MSEAQGPIDDARPWINKAERDLLTAERLLALGVEEVLDAICFHAQQSSEKNLKALLIFHSVRFPRTHDLIVLTQMLRKATAIELDNSEVSPLNRYSVETRYPGNWDPVTRAEAERAVGYARKIRDAVRAQLPLEVFEVSEAKTEEHGE
jgi:HEPN domain-containing protein